jgi:hypothetical protein
MERAGKEIRGCRGAKRHPADWSNQRKHAQRGGGENNVGPLVCERAPAWREVTAARPRARAVDRPVHFDAAVAPCPQQGRRARARGRERSHESMSRFRSEQRLLVLGRANSQSRMRRGAQACGWPRLGRCTTSHPVLARVGRCNGKEKGRSAGESARTCAGCTPINLRWQVKRAPAPPRACAPLWPAAAFRKTGNLYLQGTLRPIAHSNTCICRRHWVAHPEERICASFASGLRRFGPAPKAAPHIVRDPRRSVCIDFRTQFGCRAQVGREKRILLNGDTEQGIVSSRAAIVARPLL